MDELENLRDLFVRGLAYKAQRKVVGTVKFEDLLGKTFNKVVQYKDDELYFVADDVAYKMFHDPDCCEQVFIEDICGDLDDLVGSEILKAEETIDEKRDTIYESMTFTFYHLRTMKGTVTIRWRGESNGYYSERVDLCKVNLHQKKV